MGYYPMGYGFEQILINILYYLGVFIIIATIVCVIYGFIYSLIFGVGV